MILDRIIRIREEDGFNLTFTIQVDTACHKYRGLSKRQAGPA